MSATVGQFRELVEKAHSGELKLPGFQRTWRWRPDKVVKLYDSLRLRYPIGSFLFLSGTGAALSPRAFNGSSDEAAAATTKHLVLDGQQRLTAGIHLFFASGKRQYYINLNRISELASEKGVNLLDPTAVSEFCSSIEFDDGYLVSRPSVPDPRAFLVSHDLLCTSIITDADHCSLAILDYITAKPERKDLMLRLVQPNFALSSIEAVPHINIEEKTSTSAISRIFTTLNSTGQMLTPFELVVASLFPYKIDLQKDVADYRSIGIYYPQMDSTGEILLQTVAMLAGVDQKKSNLPRSMTPVVYTQSKDAAFEALEALGKFLTDSLGCGLNIGGNLVPYDAIYAPMAKAVLYIEKKGLSGTDLAEAHKKLRAWFAASSLTQRYQEGVHNKQVRDFRAITDWIDGTGGEPDWISEARTPSLTNKSFDGAIGKFIQCCVNHRDPLDPVVNTYKVGFRSGAMTTEKHHIFPSKFVHRLEGWDKKSDKADTLLNMMFVERSTNKSWLNHDPRDHISEASKHCSRTALIGTYARQFITEEALEILEKPAKTKADFTAFLAHRQSTIHSWISDYFGIAPLVDGGPQDDDELALEEELVEAA